MPARRRTAAAPSSTAFADALRAAIEREANDRAEGRSEYQIAKEASVSRQILSDFMKHERGMTLATFEKLAHVLGLRVVDAGTRSRGRRAPTTPRSRGGARSRQTNTTAQPDTSETPTSAA